MKAALDFIQAELHLNISTLCRHFRNKAYAQKSEAIYTAMSTLVYYQILVDELDKILWNHDQLVSALRKSSAGENFNLLVEDQTIYQYCLHYFNGDCALGTASTELNQWISSSADRNQVLRKGYYTIYPDVNIQVVEEGELRAASDAEKFEVNAESFLRDIESSNSLIEFNQLMARVRVMIEVETPVDLILSALNTEGSL